MSADLSSDKLLLPAPTIEEVSAEVLRLDPQLHPSANTFKTAVVLLSVLSVGQDLDDLAWFTGYERGFVSLIVERMSESGLWNRDRFVCTWGNGDVGEVAFWCDVLVAEGRKSLKFSTQDVLFQAGGVPFDASEPQNDADRGLEGGLPLSGVAQSAADVSPNE